MLKVENSQLKKLKDQQMSRERIHQGKVSDDKPSQVSLIGGVIIGSNAVAPSESTFEAKLLRVTSDDLHPR